MTLREQYPLHPNKIIKKALNRLIVPAIAFLLVALFFALVAPLVMLLAILLLFK